MILNDKDMENRIRNMSLSNSAHKDSLRRRLMNASAELSLDDLSGVSGGVGTEVSNPDEKWNPWPNVEYFKTNQSI